MALQHLSAFSGFVPAATGQLIAFMRDPKKYRINNYAQLVPTSKPVGVYKRMGVDQVVRAVNDEMNIWADGKKRPEFHENQLKFEDIEFQTTRRTEGFTIGWEAIENADIKVLQLHSDAARHQLMTKRVKRVVEMLETASNWGGNTASVNELNGGRGHWRDASSDPNSPNYTAIKRSLDAVALRITLATNAMIDVNEDGVLKLLLSPNLALQMSQSPEIHDYLKHSVDASNQVKGRVAGLNAKWGLPDQLYGWDLEIETTPVSTQNPTAAESFGSEGTTTGNNPQKRFVKNDNSAVALSRVGGLDGVAGSPAFSTLQIYYYGKEMEMETFDEPKHRYTQGYCTEHIKPVIAAAPSGFLITGL